MFTKFLMALGLFILVAAPITVSSNDAQIQVEVEVLFDGTPQPILLKPQVDFWQYDLRQKIRDVFEPHEAELLDQLLRAAEIAPMHFQQFISVFPNSLLYNNGLEVCTESFAECLEELTREDLEGILTDAVAPDDNCDFLKSELANSRLIYELDPNEFTREEYLLALRIFMNSACSLLDMDQPGGFGFQEVEVTEGLLETEALIEEAPLVYILMLNMFHQENAEDEVTQQYLPYLISIPSPNNIVGYLEELQGNSSETITCLADGQLLCKGNEVAERVKRYVGCKIWGIRILDDIIRCEQDGLRCDKRDKAIVNWSQSKCAS